MKIKTKEMPYDAVMAMEPPKKFKPKKPNILFRTLLKTVSLPDLFATHFKCRKIGMERLGKKEPCLFLMNHSSFIDLKIASSILYPRPFNIVCTTDGFVGKNWLMRQLGCIPTKKFVLDISLLRNMTFAAKKLNSSILMYPEAGYSFDGTATPLPDSIGRCLKMLNIPVVMIRTYGAFSRDPLYNNLQLRKVKVSADMTYLLSPQDIQEKSSEELNEIIRDVFTFDNFRWQQENQIRIAEPFRAEGLNRVLYKCPHCLAEGAMTSKGNTMTCSACKKSYELTDLGFLKAVEGETKFENVPDWYAWERECVRREIIDGEYGLDVPVDIYIIKDTRCLYKVGEGQLKHSRDGFSLSGCDGKIDFHQKPAASYTLNSDFFWYEIGDVISIGNMDVLYYCFPKTKGDFVAKTRLATEELYKIVMEEKHRKKEEKAKA